MAPQSGKYPHYIHYFHGLPVKYYINCQNKGYDKTGAYKKQDTALKNIVFIRLVIN